MKDLFTRHYLPLALLLAIAAGLALPHPGMAASQGIWLGFKAHEWLIALVFLISGLLFQVAEVPPATRLLKSAIAATGINLLGAPALAWCAIALLQEYNMQSGAVLSLGLWTMMVVPTTLSSAAVISRQAGGNNSLAVILTILLSVLGIFSAGYFTSGADSSGMSLRLFQIGKVVLLPLAMGLALRHLFNPAPGSRLKYVPSACIVMMVWLSVSRFSQTLLQFRASELLASLLLSAALHFALYAAGHLAGGLLRLPRGDRISLKFIVAQKTLPFALLLLLSESAASPTAVARAVSFCILFHFVQIAADSLLAARLANPRLPNPVQ